MKDQQTLDSRPLPRLLKASVLAALLTLCVAAVGAAEGTGTTEKIKSSLKGDWGQITVDLRYRLEYVDQEGLKSAIGDPLRLRLGYLTPIWSGFQAFAEFEGNTPVFLDDYNDNTNGKTEFAVIADPSEAELNQGWLSYEIIKKSMIRVGRQRIQLDNQRFIGNVGWRQMEQTYDSVNIVSSSFGNFSGHALYIWNVRNTASQDVGMQSPGLNLKYDFAGIGALSAYGYWLDYDDPGNSGPFEFAFSTQTYGLRFNGVRPVSDKMNALYTAEVAQQADYQDNPADYNANYLHFIIGLLWPNKASSVKNIGGKLGYEILGSDNDVSFKTPLGTNHAFNGWADQFLTAPPEGLRNFYVALNGTWMGVKGDIIFHDFRADKGGSNYGSEFDAMLTKKFGDSYILLAKYANYRAEDFKVDVEKFWLQFTVKY